MDYMVEFQIHVLLIIDYEHSWILICFNFAMWHGLYGRISDPHCILNDVNKFLANFGEAGYRPELRRQGKYQSFVT